jgi:hypothetical protein
MFCKAAPALIFSHLDLLKKDALVEHIAGGLGMLHDNLHSIFSLESNQSGKMLSICHI